MMVKNDTPGCVDIISGAESGFSGVKKAGGHLIFELV